MSRITIDVEGQDAKEQLLALAAKLNAKVMTTPETNGIAIAKLMNEIARTSKPMRQSPIDWQRELRQDRKLPNRD
jgi:hypothetical protein